MWRGAEGCRGACQCKCVGKTKESSSTKTSQRKRRATKAAETLTCLGSDGLRDRVRVKVRARARAKIRPRARAWARARARVPDRVRVKVRVRVAVNRVRKASTCRSAGRKRYCAGSVATRCASQKVDWEPGGQQLRTGGWAALT